MTTVLDLRSDLQRIRLTNDPLGGLTLYLDEAVQFCQATEHRYHECLAVVPALHVRNPRRVFVAGGGDGLAVTRLLGLPWVEEIVLCDYDPEMTRLAREQSDWRLLNEGSLDDPRVRIVNEDAARFLEEDEGAYDLVLCDFPDASCGALADLYTPAFYELLRRRLHPEGAVCVQTMATGSVPAVVGNTLSRVFPHVRYFSSPYRSGGKAGFTLAAPAPLVLRHETPRWCRFLDDDVLPTLFVEPPDERIPSDEVNLPGGTALLEAMARAYAGEANLRPCPYAPAVRCLAMGGMNEPGVDACFAFMDREASPFLVYVDRESLPSVGDRLLSRGFRHLRSYRRMAIALRPDVHDELDRRFARLHDGEDYEVRCHVGAVDGDPACMELWDAYAAEHGRNYFDVPPTRPRPDHERAHLVVRDGAGHPFMLMVIRAGITLDVEVLFGRASSRRNMLGLLLCLRFAEQELGTMLEFEAATTNVEKFMIKLGAVLQGFTDVYLSDSACP